jgi:hypothetical protein
MLTYAARSLVKRLRPATATGKRQQSPRGSGRCRAVAQTDARPVTATQRGYGCLPFAPVDWVSIVDAAPIPLAFDLRATRHRQMIEQVRQRVFLTVESY